MPKLSRWISIFCLICGLNAAAQQHYPLLLNGQQRAAWNFTLQRGTMTLTGICIVRQLDESLAGSVVNEFGIKAFDFTVKNDRIRLTNVFAPMDKWYIRRVLRADLSLLTCTKPTSPSRRRTLIAAQPDSIVLINHRRGLTYRFLRIDEDSGGDPADTSQ